MQVKLKARKIGEDPELVNALVASGIDAKLVRGAVVAILPKHPTYRDWTTPKHLIYSIPNEMFESDLLIESFECGGAMSNTGTATCVCGLSGKALKPYYLPMTGNLSNGCHAYFCVPGGVITVTALKKSGRITIDEFICESYIDSAQIHHKEIWSGYDIQALPEIFDRYAACIAATVKKANTYHCRMAMFVDRG